MEEVRDVLVGLDWSPLFISLKTGVVATIISFFLGIYTARKVVKASPAKKAVLDGIFLWCFPRLLRDSFYCCCSAGEDLWESFFTSSLISRSYRLGWDVLSRQLLSPFR